MNIVRLQADQFGNPQTAPVRGHQQHAMLDVAAGVEEPRDLTTAQRFGQSTAAFGGNPQLKIPLAQHFPIEEANSRQLLVAGAVGHLLHRDQVMEEASDLLQGNLVRRAAVEAAQLGHTADIRLDRRGGLAMQFEFTDHLRRRGVMMTAPWKQGTKLGKHTLQCPSSRRA